MKVMLAALVILGMSVSRCGFAQDVPRSAHLGFLVMGPRLAMVVGREVGDTLEEISEKQVLVSGLRSSLRPSWSGPVRWECSRFFRSGALAVVLLFADCASDELIDDGMLLAVVDARGQPIAPLVKQPEGYIASLSPLSRGPVQH